MKTDRLVLLAAVGLATVALLRPAMAQDPRHRTGCQDLNWDPLPANDPAYPDAMDLARTLTDHQFLVACVAPSTMVGTFEGQEGAALYSTNVGSFEALFLFRPQNFDDLQVIERRERGRYLYSFSGRPKPWPANLIDSVSPMQFIKRGYQLIVVQDDARLAARLRVLPISLQGLRHGLLVSCP